MSSRMTLFGEVPLDWTISEIGEIADLRQGLQISKKLRVDNTVQDSIPLLKITDLPTGIFSEYVKDIPENYIASEEDIIYTRTGQVGLVYTNVNGCVHNNCFKVIVDYNKFDKNYIYYYLKSDNVYKYSNSVAGGSVQKDLTHGAFKKCKIAFPSLEEQRKIGNFLINLDKKIETNNKINKKLEEMAQAIFKQWFVDFEFPNEYGKPYKSSSGEMVESELGMIPKGWEYKKLDDVLNTIEAGNRPKGGAGNLTEGIPSIGAENIIGLGKYDYSKEKFVTEDYFNSMKKGIVQSKDVLLYKDGAQLGRKTMFMDGFPHEKCCINSHVFILRSNNSISQSYLYFWLDQDYMTQNIINLNANSAQPGINQIQVKSLNILVPTKEIIEKFELTVNSLLDKLFVNCKENTKLANIRDTLLPKLMSGEIRVPLD